MTPEQVYRLAHGAGLSHDPAIIATAIGWAESGLDPDAEGDEDLADAKWGPSIGIWQIRSLRADKGTGRTRDADRLMDPAFNAASMATISSGGTDWTPWTMFRNGAYLEHIRAVRDAVDGGEPSMQLVTRAEWGARPATTSTDITPVGVAVHWEGPHIGTFPHSSCAALVRGIQAYHMDTNGWADIAYSAIACPHGFVFAGRGPGHRTAANGTNDGNQRYYAVCFLGGEDDLFTVAGVGPSGRHNEVLAVVLDRILLKPVAPVSPLARLAFDTGSARQAINDAIDWLGGGEVVGHRDLTSTACPGDEIEAWVQAGHPSPDRPAPPAPDPEPTPDPKEDVMQSPVTLFNWGGGVWSWLGGDPLPLRNNEQVYAYLNRDAITIGDLDDAQFEAIAPTWQRAHPFAGEMDAAAEAVRAAPAAKGS